MNEKKMAWVKWDTICKPKNEGGLGVKNLSLFNKALLSKWIWRFMRDEDSLWSRILRARHGDISYSRPGRFGASERGPKTGWWSKILAMAEANRDSWFWGNMYQKLGNGNTISFWYGLWNGDKSLSDSFPRLCHLSAKRDGTVSEMGKWVEGCWEWELPWRREILDREQGGVEELLNILSNHSVVVGTNDEWKWSASSNGIFSVKVAYEELVRKSDNSQLHLQSWSGFHHLWKSYAPLKAKLMAWRLAYERLPTGDNLGKRFELTWDRKHCCCCTRELESAVHFFLLCTNVHQL